MDGRMSESRIPTSPLMLHTQKSQLGVMDKTTYDIRRRHFACIAKYPRRL